MTREADFPPPWIRVRQEPLLSMAGNARFPNALRVYFFALGNVRANGHAKLNKGELAEFLGHPDDAQGWVSANYRTVWTAIRQAVDNEWLAEDSKALCLVVPSHHVRGGEGGDNAACPRHPKAKRSAALKAVS